MSLANLPTELDFMIISLLDDDRLALARLSKVLHYYRSKTKPSLHNIIALDFNDHIS
jgi:hypothetical protein